MQTASGLGRDEHVHLAGSCVGRRGRQRYKGDGKRYVTRRDVL